MKSKSNKIKALAIGVIVLIVLAVFCVKKTILSSHHPGIFADGGTINSVSFSNDDTQIAVASMYYYDDPMRWPYGGVQVWNVQSQTLYGNVCFGQYHPLTFIVGYYSMGGRQLVVEGPSSATGIDIMVYDSLHLRQTNEKPAQYITPQHLLWANGSSAAIRLRGNKDVAQIKAGNKTFVIQTEYKPTHLAVNPAAGKLAIADTYGNAAIYDLLQHRFTDHISRRHGKLPEKFDYDGAGDVVTSLIWLPKQSILSISNTHGRLILWSALLHKIISDVKAPDKITCSAVSHSGNLIAYGTEGGAVKIIATKKLVQAAMSSSIVHLLK